VTAGRETVVEFGPAPVTEPPPEVRRAKTRKIVGGVAMGAGAVMGAIAIVELVRYVNLQSDGDEAAKAVPASDTPCRDQGVSTCATIDSQAKTASGLAWGLGGASVVALGVGAYLFFTDSGGAGETKAAATPPKPTTRVVPSVGAGSGALTVVGTF
jgi:hypothetical protein